MRWALILIMASITAPHQQPTMNRPFGPQRPTHDHVGFVDQTPGARLPVLHGIKASPVPVSTTVPLPASGGGHLTSTEVAGYLRAAGFPESAIPTMVGYAARESGFCPTAVNGYGCAGLGHAYAGGPACGLLQLYPCPGPAALGPLVNCQLAYAKYEASGFAPWGG